MLGYVHEKHLPEKRKYFLNMQLISRYKKNSAINFEIIL